MTVTAVIGGQWGDEGKGKIVDLLSSDADVVIRFNGADNAGHTVVKDGKVYKLHLVPSGIISGKKCVIGPGVACNPSSLLEEIANLRSKDVVVSSDNLFVAERTHILRPFDILLDGLRSNNMNHIGTTNRGVGPCYADKINREGIRYCDNDETIKKRVDADLKKLKEIQQASEGNSALVKSFIEATERLLEQIKQIKPFVRDIFEIYDYISQGRGIESLEVLLEGAQGSLLDIDFGTYPYVTSSNIVNYSLAGINPRMIREVIGVFKAYTTRVGGGPFPTEQQNDLGELLRSEGKEFGTTTGRPRRCGWFDAFAAQYAKMFCHFDNLAITKLDVLTGIDQIPVCVGYELDGKILNSFPANAEDLKKVKPLYINMDGWNEFPKKVDSLNDLPDNAVIYLKKLSALLGEIPIKYVSYSPETSGTLVLTLDSSLCSDNFERGRVLH